MTNPGVLLLWTAKMTTFENTDVIHIECACADDGSTRIKLFRPRPRPHRESDALEVVWTRSF